MSIDSGPETMETLETASDDADPFADDPGIIKLPPVLNYEAATAVLDAVRNAAAMGAAICIDASDVDRLHTPVAQILVSAARSSDLAIRAPSEEFIAACTDLGVWSLISERIET